MLFMQPVQDLTVERPGEPDAVSVLAWKTPMHKNSDVWAPRLVEKLKRSSASAGCCQ